MKPSHEIDIYVRLSETDAMGHINNVSYFNYFEEARTRFFADLLDSGNSINNFILASTGCDYVSQAYAFEVLKLETYVEKIGTKSVTLGHTLINPKNDVIISKANAVLVCFDYDRQTTIEISDDMRERLEERIISHA